jgi:hypothetical protein
LAWNDLDEPHRGRHDELLSRVVGRGERLRQRRRVAWSAAAVSALLAVAVPAAAWRGADRSGGRVVSASGGVASTDASTGAGGTMDGTTTVPAPTDSAVPATPPPPSDARSTTTTSRPTAGAPSPGVPPPSASPTPTAQAGEVEQPPRCTAADLEVAATSDKSSYGPGEVVKVAGTLRNRSSQTCTYGASLTFQVLDGAGAVVYGPLHTHADYLAGHEPTLAPGQSVPTFPAQWDQQVCVGLTPCRRAMPGPYTIVFDVRYASVTIPVTISPE